MSAYIELIKEDTIRHKGVTLYRIRAKKDIPNKNYYVTDGTIGGYVQSLCNVLDNAWVGETAKLWEDARARNDAWIYGDAEVRGAAAITDSGIVHGWAVVAGMALVSGRVGGNAMVTGEAFIRGTAGGSVSVYGGVVPEGAEVVCGIIRKPRCCVLIRGLRYVVTISPGWMCIGCQTRTMDAWFNDTDEQFLLDADGEDAADFWALYKDALKVICDEVTKNDQD